MGRMTDTSAWSYVVTGGAAMIGGFLGPWFLRGPERRTARAGVQSAFAKVLHNRYEGAQLTYEESVGLVQDFEAAALIARLPRGIADVFVALVETTWRDSAYMAEIEDNDELGIRTALWHCLREADDLVVDALWRPLRTRSTYKKRIKILHAHVENALEEVSDQNDCASIWNRYRDRPHPWES